MSGVVVIGAGGHAKVVISVLRAAGLDVAGVVDDDESKKGERLLGVPVIGKISMLRGSEFEGGVIAIGRNLIREQVAAKVKLKWLCVVHPAAYVHESVKLGEGTVVFAGAVIQPDTTIGRHVIVNTGATIDHDCEIADFVHIAPGVHLAGGIKIGKGSLVGIGSVAIPGIRIGDRTTVGAGSAIVRDICNDAVAYGVPAKKVRGAKPPPPPRLR